MASYEVPLSVSLTCASVGTKPGDNTIGAYLSGFLSELKDQRRSKNWIETRVKDAKDVWKCELTVRHSLGEDEWGWGVRFDVKKSDANVIRDLFECTGGA
jgi:hypothetical protein